MNQPLILLVFFLAGVLGVLGFRMWEAQKIKGTTFIPQKSSFTLKPPSESLTGEFVEIVGKVTKEARGEDEFEEIGEGDGIFDGEKVATGKLSRTTIRFEDFGAVALGPSSEVTFVNTLPLSFLVLQSTGETEYQLSSKKYPLSVRSLNMLFTQDIGISTITTDAEDKTITVKLLKGTGNIALVDLDNETHVWKIEKGERALIDDVKRTVNIIK